jgi:flagellar biosynthesis/type III secretory pathway protein FliH
MRRSLAHYPRLIDRFVDDALRACGRPRRAIVRVNPGDAKNVTPRDGVEIVADEAVEPGACSVDTPAGRLGASVEQRAMRLAQSAAEHA